MQASPNRDQKDQNASSPNTSWLNNRYRLLALIAGGGMATVYKAQDTLLNRVVAIKTLRDQFALDPQFMSRFRDEAQAAANLNHPNVVTVFDVGKDKLQGVERQYLVMEYVEGHDLKYIIRDRLNNSADQPPFSIDEAVNIIRQVCEGVGSAHNRGLAHCDLKPQNVMVSPSGRVKVTDFGIARAYTALANERSETVWGTPQYFAPEQASGHPTTAASDVYSIGVMLYELLAGRLPFESRDAKELARMHVTARQPDLHTFNPLVPLQLESIVNRAMAKDPANRYRDANQFARVLDAYLRQGEENTMMSGNAAPRGDAGRSGRPAPSKPVPQPVPKPVPPQSNKNDATMANSAVTPPGGMTSANPGSTSSGMTSVTGLTTIFRTSDGGTDVLVWVLSAIAFACVLGLIPLYLSVYRIYTDPPGDLPPATRAAVATVPAGGNASVPPLASATQAPAIATQLIPADLANYVLSDPILEQLRSVGWKVTVSEQASFAPERQILRTDPPVGSRLSVTGSLTVYVSTGGRIPIGATLSPIVLDSVKLNAETFKPGQTMEVGLRWQTTGRVTTGYKTAVHVLDANADNLRAQGDDREPRDNGVPAPTVTWTTGRSINDTFSVTLPNNLPPGRYRLMVSMYNDQGRLRVTNPGRATAANNSLVVKVFEVVR